MTRQGERPAVPAPPAPAGPRPVRRRWQRVAPLGLAAAAMVLAGAGLVGRQLVVSPAPASSGAPATGPVQLTARGQVRPVAQARVGTVAGGVIERLTVHAGDAVFRDQEIARVRGPSGVEVVMAPFGGTITGVQARFGDTLPPGAPIATLGDLSRLQVETSDVDEYLIPYVQLGQRVTLVIDALDVELAGEVRVVALEPTVTPLGDEHYPVTIEVLDPPPQLRAGMTVRVRFPRP